MSDIPAPSPSDVNVTGTVRAPIDKVWELFRPFGPDVTKWWKIAETVTLEAPGKDEVGAVRRYKSASGRTYEEKLLVRDDDKHVETYQLLTATPSVPSLTTTYTTVTMTAKGANETEVNWRAQNVGGGAFISMIKSTQAGVYAGANKDLDAHFHPAFGKLKVSVKHAANLPKKHFFSPDPYVIVDLDDDPPQRTGVKLRTINPIWNDDLEFEIASKQGTLKVTVWDANVGADEFLGEGDVDIHGIETGKEVVRTIKIDQGELTVGLTLTLDDGNELGETDATLKEQHLAELMKTLDGIKEQALDLVLAVSQGENKPYGYGRYPQLKSMPGVPLQNLPRTIKGLPPSLLLSPRKISRMIERATEFAYDEADFLTRMKSANPPMNAFFTDRWIKKPEYVAEHWQEDTELARELIQGPGPMVIEVVSNPGQVPASMTGLTAQGKSIDELIADKRLFICDYKGLASLENYRNMYLYAPIMLVYKELLDGGKSRLNILGIQLTREDSGNKIYTPGSNTPVRYQLAKMFVALADMQYQEWVWHLGYAHVMMEPFCVAILNSFDNDHPIGKLLAPHIRETIGINYAARRSLVNPVVPITDRVFATGTGQALKVALDLWEQFDFFKYTFPEMLKARGFDEAGTDGLEDYYYRDDGFKIWNAMSEYVSDVVNHVYADDAAVKNDASVQAWAAETCDPERADVPTFPASIDTRELLAQVLTILIWNLSAAHAAVNYTQYDFNAYVPNRPPSLFKPMPEGDDDIDLKYIQDALPSPLIIQFQIVFSYVLSLPSLTPLSTVDAMKEVAPAAHTKFHARLSQISKELGARNAALEAEGKMPYPYLMPENIAASVEI